MKKGALIIETFEQSKLNRQNKQQMIVLMKINRYFTESVYTASEFAEKSGLAYSTVVKYCKNYINNSQGKKIACTLKNPDAKVMSFFINSSELRKYKKQ